MIPYYKDQVIMHFIMILVVIIQLHLSQMDMGLEVSIGRDINWP